jgi:hypothetical protein
MRTDNDYKRQKEYAKENRKAKKKIPAESKKRKKERIRYIEQNRLFKQEKKDNGEYVCFITGEEFDNSLENFPVVHHLRGRTGDYYLDKQYFVLVGNKIHTDVFHGGRDILKLMKEPWWDGFLTRLRAKDDMAYRKLMKQIERASEIF